MSDTHTALARGALLSTTLASGQVRFYRLSVAAGETLRVEPDSSAADGACELFIRYGEVPTGPACHAAYGNPVAPDQQVLIPTTLAGDCCMLVRARQSAAGKPETLRADRLPLAITRATPDQRGATVAAAGVAGRITVATNMAGRGTEIKPDAAARAAGGLQVILAEFHESRPVDRQFFGRSGRQGDHH